MKLEDLIDLIVFPIFTICGGIVMYLRSLTKDRPFSYLLFLATILYALITGCFIVFIGKAFLINIYLVGALCCLAGIVGNDVIYFLAKKYIGIDVKKPSQ